MKTAWTITMRCFKESGVMTEAGALAATGSINPRKVRRKPPLRTYSWPRVVMVVVLSMQTQPRSPLWRILREKFRSRGQVVMAYDRVVD